MADQKKGGMNMTPLVGSSMRNWIKLLLLNGPPDVRYMHRVLLVSLVVFIGIPFRIYENLKLKKKLKETRVPEDPVFIIGHWRSGTTLVHNIISKDPQFGVITTLQCLFPYSFISTNIFRLFMKLFMPKTRPMDNMKLNVDSGQEEELAIGSMSTYSFYHGWSFPWHFEDFYHRYIRFHGVTEYVRESWKKIYHEIIIRATINSGGKRIISKNPPNTGRIRELLELYPNAKFIHIYRNPYIVYLSTKILYDKAVPYFMLQKPRQDDMEDNIFFVYEELMTSYFEEKSLIPEGNLIEIRYEDMDNGPLDIIEDIYTRLNIKGFKEAKPLFEAYLKTLGGYKKNKYEFSPHLLEKIGERWRFTIDEWGYSVPE